LALSLQYDQACISDELNILVDCQGLSSERAADHESEWTISHLDDVAVGCADFHYDF
jgi:hypothetical protein